MNNHIQGFIDSELEFTFLIEDEADKDLIVRREIEKHIDDPHYLSTYLFNTYPEFTQQDTRDHDLAIVDRHFTNFKEDGVSLHGRKRTVTWPSGAKLRLDYMNMDRHAECNHCGLQYSSIFWNEFTDQSEYQFRYLGTRMRSASRATSYMKMFTKVDRRHFSYKFLEPFLESSQVGGSRGDNSGRECFFLQSFNLWHCSFDREVLEKTHPDLAHMISSYTVYYK